MYSSVVWFSVCQIFQLTLTQTHVVTRERVSMMTGAAVTAHGVVTVVLTSAVPSAALIHICKSHTHTFAVSQSGAARDVGIGWCGAGGRSQCWTAGRKSLIFSSEGESLEMWMWLCAATLWVWWVMTHTSTCYIVAKVFWMVVNMLLAVPILGFWGPYAEWGGVGYGCNAVVCVSLLQLRTLSTRS